MKKALLSFLFLSAGFVFVFAQDAPPPEPKGFIGISLGPSFAVSDFGDNTYSNEKSGYARGGFSFNFNLGYRFTDNLGICGIWGASINLVDVDQMVKDVASQSTDKTVKWSVESENWSVGYSLGGGLLTLPGSKVDLDMKLMVGLMNATYPEMTIKGTKGSLTLSSVMERATGISLAAGVGASLRFHLSPKLDLLTNVDYITGKPKFETKMNTGSTSVDANFSQSITIMNLSLGLAYRF